MGKVRVIVLDVALSMMKRKLQVNTLESSALDTSEEPNLDTSRVLLLKRIRGWFRL